MSIRTEVAEVPQHPGKLTRRHFLRDATIVGAGAAVAAAATQSGILERAVNAVAEWYDPSAKKQNPEVFDQTREFIEVSSKNSVAVKPAELQTLGVELKIPDPDNLIPFKPSESSVGEYYTKDSLLEIPLPFTVPENSNISLQQLSLMSGPNSPIKDTIMVDGLSKGTVVYAPVDGTFQYSLTTNSSGVGTSASLWTPDINGDQRSLFFQTGASRTLIDQSKVSIKPRNQYTMVQESIQVKAGDPLFTIEDANGRLKLNLSPGASDRNGQPLRNSEGLTYPIYSPLTIKTVRGKATYIKP